MNSTTLILPLFKEVLLLILFWLLRGELERKFEFQMLKFFFFFSVHTEFETSLLLQWASYIQRVIQYE